jgi:hypothetical protein
VSGERTPCAAQFTHAHERAGAPAACTRCCSWAARSCWRPSCVMLLVSLIPNSAFLARDFSPANFSPGQLLAHLRGGPLWPLLLQQHLCRRLRDRGLQILISSLAAFAFARLRFRGREAIFLFYLATLMIPFPVTLIPNFLIVKNLGWYDTYLALIVPGLFSVFSTLSAAPVLPRHPARPRRGRAHGWRLESGASGGR